MKEIIITSDAPQAIGPYSQAVKANGFLFVSGQLPIDPATGNFASGGVEEQTEAGVGALSGGLTGFFADLYGDNEDHPIVTIIEPNKADCIYRTAKANNGKLHFVIGDMNTIMAVLACGEPCTIGWNILHDHADNFVSMPDYVAAKGMRILGNPLSGDDKVISGESGATTLGFVAEVMQNPNPDWLREQLKLDKDSTILCFSTEGDTDKANYRRIV